MRLFFSFAAALLIGFLTLTPASADDTYRAFLSGCGCGTCKKKVVMSFASLECVESVRFLKGKRKDQYEVVVVTDGSLPISRNQAAELTKVSPSFKLKAWEKE